MYRPTCSRRQVVLLLHLAPLWSALRCEGHGERCVMVACGERRMPMGAALREGPEHGHLPGCLSVSS